MSRFSLWILVFGVVFAAATSLVSPNLLAWYATPPVPIGVSCDPAISWAMQNLIRFQAAGFIVGLILGGVIFSWVRGKKSPPKTQST